MTLIYLSARRRLGLRASPSVLGPSSDPRVGPAADKDWDEGRKALDAASPQSPHSHKFLVIPACPLCENDIA